jgi:hypothetical protein
VRTFVIPYCLCLVLSLSLTAPAEVIRLKNGDVIYADEVKQNADRVAYEVGDNSYTIPRSRVLSIESSPSEPAGPHPLQFPELRPEMQLGGEQDMLAQVVHDHQVDRAALAAIEAARRPNQTAIAHYLAGKAEFEADKFSDSRHDFETALRFQPDSPAILTYYAAVLVRTGNALDAISCAQRATRIVPDSPDALAVLGYAQLSASRSRDAIESWKKSLALRPDATLERMLARAERESAAETNYSERDSGHFALRFEGGQSSDLFRDQLLATLEAHFEDLSRTFGSEPPGRIQVVLYTSQSFFDVTRAPSWTGALNDGKLRIPLRGVDFVTPSLARILRHELAHSFVNQLAANRCPEWLNEGIAQMLEPRSLAGERGRLAELWQSGREIPLNRLDHGFASLSAAEAALAYDESLAVVSYIDRRYGMAELVRLLTRMGQGDSAEFALRSLLHSDYGRLMDDVRSEFAQPSENPTALH